MKKDIPARSSHSVKIVQNQFQIAQMLEDCKGEHEVILILGQAQFTSVHLQPLNAVCSWGFETFVPIYRGDPIAAEIAERPSNDACSVTAYLENTFPS